MSEPILRWAGSKKKLLPLLAAATPSRFNRYVEPFVGSAVLFLRLDAREAILGDINADLIDTYTTLRDHPHEIWDRVSAMSQDQDYYYELRAQSTASLSKLDRAARSGGHLYVPDIEVFDAVARALRRAYLHCGDFDAVVNRAECGDFLYLDPPYALGGKRDRGEYGMGSFRETDEERLVESIQRASARGAHVLLSYSPSSQVIENLPGWHVHELTVALNVAGFAGSRRQADEILVSNYRWRN